jgi:hypothetical protein
MNSYFPLPDSPAESKVEVKEQPSDFMAMDIRTIFDAEYCQVASHLIDKNYGWLTIVSRYLGHKDLSCLFEVCRFFSRPRLFMDLVTANKYKIAKLSLILARDYADQRILSWVADGLPMDREIEMNMKQNYLMRLLNNDQSLLFKIKRHYNKNQTFFKIYFGSYGLFIIGATILMIHSIVSDRGQNISEDIGFGCLLTTFLSTLCCCYKCGVVENLHVEMIKEIEQSFASLKSQNLLPSDVFPDGGSTRTELQGLLALSNFSE